MTDLLAPDSLEKIPTLVDHERKGRFVIAFCPVCDRTEETAAAELGREQAAAAAIAKIKGHIQKATRPRRRY